MITIIKTYQINTSCKGEVVTDVIDLFCSISDTMFAIYDDNLPEDYAQQIITIFTTISVPDFNNLFTKLCTDLISIELQASINNSLITLVGGINLKNDMKTVHYVLKYARLVYNNFVQKGEWDKCINGTPSQSGLLTTNPLDAVSENYFWFYCGKKGHHKKENCPEEINKERQKLEREKFNLLKGRTPKQGYKFTNAGRPIPLKGRPPEPSKQNK